MVSVVAAPVARQFTVRTHAHPRELQFDLISGSRGTAVVGSQTVDVSGLTLLVHYPGERHGFELSGGTRWHLKVVAGPSDAVARRRVWDEAMAGQPRMERLTQMATELAKYPAIGADRPPRMLALVADLLASWPPRDVSAIDAAAVEDERDLGDAVRLVQTSTGAPPTLDEMARAAHLSRRHFTRRFRLRFGCSPTDFADAHRLGRAKAMLAGGGAAAGDVAAAVGFSTHSAFSRWFSRHVGQTPGQFRLDPQAV